MFIRKRVYVQITNIFKRHYGQKPRPQISFTDDVDKAAESEDFRPKKHPGRVPFKSVALPEEIVSAIKVVLGDVPFQGVLKDSIKLANFLWSRNYPVEEKELIKKRNEIEKRLSSLETFDITGKEQQEVDKILKQKERKIIKKVKEELHTWKNIQLDNYIALQYLVRRAPADFAALHNIFYEINMREADFKPKTFFDFGSGVGTGTWAARHFWGNYLKEFFTVDTAPDANNIARRILCGGAQDAEIPIKKYFQRQFLPATPVKFDLVLSAFSLFELPTAKSRLMTVQNLWKRTNEFLVLVEVGTNAGFRIINEARDFILETQEDDLVGHVFSPCPHDMECARYMNDVIPCNFPVQFKTLSFNNKSETGHLPISYVVLRKGLRSEDDEQWPRIVKPVLIRSKHSICRMCCADGDLKEVIFTASKHGKVLYKCARSSGWGDRLPVHIKETQTECDTLEEADLADEQEFPDDKHVDLSEEIHLDETSHSNNLSNKKN